MGAVQTDAVARAMAVLERSAAMGVIVAAPTAGSAGVVPGCVFAVADATGATERDVASALWCAAAVAGSSRPTRAWPAPRAAARPRWARRRRWPAAALVELLGGTPEQALCAASLAISNLLGLVCDPVGGLVDVPLPGERNAIGVAAAFSAAQLALSACAGSCRSTRWWPAMAEVGHALPSRLRETARGGLAATPTARGACAGCGGLCVARVARTRVAPIGRGRRMGKSDPVRKEAP